MRGDKVHSMSGIEAHAPDQTIGNDWDGIEVELVSCASDTLRNPFLTGDSSSED